jgi:branched-chain amino acid transport system ATP-binding protein
MSEAPDLLVLDDVHAYYGLSHVLQGVSLTVARGSVVSLMGRNGVGKSTTLKSIFGIVHVAAGRIRFADEDLVGLPAYSIARRGIALVPEDRRIFSTLTVRENILLAARGRKDAIDEALGWFPQLRDYLARPGDRLSGGEQQMLAIARALVAHPELVLIDEPLEGLAPIIAERIGETLTSLRGRMTVLLVEQNLKWLLQVAHYHYVMDHGRIAHHGTSEWLRANPDLVEQYLGVAA